MVEIADPYPLLIVAFAVFLVPFLIVAVTAFIKISVVLFILRSALAVQQTPPNIVLYAVALVLSAYVMAPVGAGMQQALADGPAITGDLVDIAGTVERAVEPLRAFLMRYAGEEHRVFFLASTEELWPPEVREGLEDDDMIVLIPAFITSELTRAFEIGILLYLPFIVIDLLITNILTAMGMMMVSPTVISLPFKLLLFVAADGWTRLTHGLVLSYV
ncbi:MAG: type III secretion system export apparatus subunit SctR [Pseudomonadota bacterium]